MSKNSANLLYPTNSIRYQKWLKKSKIDSGITIHGPRPRRGNGEATNLRPVCELLRETPCNLPEGTMEQKTLESALGVFFLET